jgi:hypothetical protein
MSRPARKWNQTRETRDKIVLNSDFNQATWRANKNIKRLIIN